jgi:hypothetical protein
MTTKAVMQLMTNNEWDFYHIFFGKNRIFIWGLAVRKISIFCNLLGKKPKKYGKTTIFPIHCWSSTASLSA